MIWHIAIELTLHMWECVCVCVYTTLLVCVSLSISPDSVSVSISVFLSAYNPDISEQMMEHRTETKLETMKICETTTMTMAANVRQK